MPYLSPPTLTRSEQEALLHASASHSRDHLIFSLALGTGLRLSEIVGLNAGDVFLPDALGLKLVRFWGYKVRSDRSLSPSSPLLCNKSGQRISKRRIQSAFRDWQVRAGFDRLYGIHALRHTAVTEVYRLSRDLFLAQRFARHVSPLTTVVYTNPSDEELFRAIRGLGC